MRLVIAPLLAPLLPMLLATGSLCSTTSYWHSYSWVYTTGTHLKILLNGSHHDLMSSLAWLRSQSIRSGSIGAWAKHTMDSHSSTVTKDLRTIPQSYKANKWYKLDNVNPSSSTSKNCFFTTPIYLKLSLRNYWKLTNSISCSLACLQDLFYNLWNVCPVQYIRMS